MSGIRVYSDAGHRLEVVTMRRSRSELVADLAGMAIEALESKVGPIVEQRSAGTDDVLVIDVDGRHQVVLALRVMAYATLERLEGIDAIEPDLDGTLEFVVADRINGPAREAMESAGWGYFEVSSGRLVLRAPGLRIDTVARIGGPLVPEPSVGVIGRSGIVLAYELLRRRFDGATEPVRTTTSKEEFGLAGSSLSDAMGALRAAGLVTPNGEPTPYELFWELAAVWPPAERRWLAAAPEPGEGRWRAGPGSIAHLGGLGAAIFHGAPAVAAGEVPIDLYVPNQAILTAASRRYGSADPIGAAASVAIPRAHQVLWTRDERRLTSHRGWPVVHPVAAALDLAAIGDARSSQILDEWSPDGEVPWHDR